MTASKPRASQGGWLAHRAPLLLSLYALVLVVVLLSPTSDVQRSLVIDIARALRVVLPDSWVTFSRVEVATNAVIIAPISFLGSIVWQRLRWQDWVAYGFLGASAIELTQGLLLPHRSASFSDIVANTMGALIGALVWRLFADRPAEKG